MFFPTFFQQLISILFLPLTLFYCVVSTYNRVSKKPFDFQIPIISIGNLLVGGTGKTPVTVELAKNEKDAAIVLRGYGRKSKGLFVVSNKGKILEDIAVSGDEAMLYAKSLPNAIVIVSEIREEGIEKAKQLGAKVVFLDDGFSKHQIKKIDILIRPKDEPTNVFCLPSGGYRDTKMMYSFVDCVLKEGTDFERIVSFKYKNLNVDTLPKNLVLITAVSKAYRLLEYLPKDTKTEIFPDHYNFTKEDIATLRSKYPDSSFITTGKDFVKLEAIDDDFYLMELQIKILNDKVFEVIEKYKNSFI